MLALQCRVSEEPRGFLAKLLQIPVHYTRKGWHKMNSKNNFKKKGKKVIFQPKLGYLLGIQSSQRRGGYKGREVKKLPIIKQRTFQIVVGLKLLICARLGGFSVAGTEGSFTLWE